MLSKNLTIALSVVGLFATAAAAHSEVNIVDGERYGDWSFVKSEEDGVGACVAVSNAVSFTFFYNQQLHDAGYSIALPYFETKDYRTIAAKNDLHFEFNDGLSVSVKLDKDQTAKDTLSMDPVGFDKELVPYFKSKKSFEVWSGDEKVLGPVPLRGFSKAYTRTMSCF